MKNTLKSCARLAALLGLFHIPVLVAADVVNIGSAKLSELLATGTTVVDVRTADEWAELGLVEGSEKLTFFDPAGNYDAAKWLSELSGVASKEQPVILICLTGSRSRLIADWLKNRVGYERVYNVELGIADWIKKGNPVIQE